MTPNSAPANRIDRLLGWVLNGPTASFVVGLIAPAFYELLRMEGLNVAYRVCLLTILAMGPLTFVSCSVLHQANLRRNHQ